jgi:hypothetical protein
MKRRRCKQCNRVKPLLSGFARRSEYGGQYFRHVCKVCRRGYGTAWIAKNYTKFLCQQVRYRCKRDGIPFDITPADIIIPERCPLLPEIKLARGHGVLQPCSPSLDRLDPTKGYVRGNIWVISYRANAIKQNASLQELETLVGNLRLELERRQSEAA